MKTNRASSDEVARTQVRPVRVQRVVSGGQTGADRAALDFAIRRGIPHGGWCPRGRLAEDGVIGMNYGLKETPLADCAQRTEWNVRESDGTVIFSIARTLSGGSKATQAFAARLRKPCLHLSMDLDGAAAAGRLCRFIERYHIQVLNIAGPRASTETEVGAFVTSVLKQAIVSD